MCEICQKTIDRAKAITNLFETKSIVSASDTIFSVTEKIARETPSAVS